MKPLIWLASYPKSGNTWFRILIANLNAPEPVDINDLPERGGIASSRGMFDGITMLPSTLLTHTECDLVRPLVYRALAGQCDIADLSPNGGNANGRPRFVKSHDAYTRNQDGAALLGGDCARGAVLVVRDPRDVAVSLAHHSGRTIDQTIEFMADPQASFDGLMDRQGKQLRQQLPGWSGYHRSWTQQIDIPVHIVQYEDLHAMPIETLAGAFAFAGITASETAIKRAIDFSSFRNLRDQERLGGFKERPRAKPGPFFRRGVAGAWRNELSAAQAALIESDHKETMMQFGYSGVKT